MFNGSYWGEMADDDYANKTIGEKKMASEQPSS